MISLITSSSTFLFKSFGFSICSSTPGSTMAVLSDCFEPRVATRYMREITKRAMQMYLMMVSLRLLQYWGLGFIY